MANYVAFRFTDNDFHGPLREAIEYVVANRQEELTLENFREFVLRGLVAFDSLRSISNGNWTLAKPQDYRKYFEDTLTVSEVNKVADLEDFEGYVFDTNTFDVYYVGY